MKKLIEKRKLVLAIAIGFVLGALGYVVLTPKIYVASSRVAIFRMKIENPEIGSDESRNRWIWIRDGLNINSALVSDSQIKQFIDGNNIAKNMAKSFLTDFAKIRFFKNMVNVQYTGADESNYVIEVKAPDRKLAYDLTEHIFKNLRFLAIEKDKSDFMALEKQIQTGAMDYPKESPERAFYLNKLVKMQFEQTVKQAQKEKVFQVISEPSLNDEPIWPKPAFIVLVALIIGTVVGFSFEYLIFLLREQR